MPRWLVLLLFAALSGCIPAGPLIGPGEPAGPVVPQRDSVAACGFRPAFTRPDERGTQTMQVYESAPDPRTGGATALLFISTLKVNTDGTRISYHQRDPLAERLAINAMRNAMHKGRTVAEFESVANAGWPLPRTWEVLKPNVIEKDRTSGKPCVDRDGYLISMTSDVSVAGGFNRVGDCDPAKWIDALSVPALVLPQPGGPGQSTEFDARGATNRSPVVAMTLDPARRLSLGIVGDKGPVNELGEASVAMNRQLNGLADTDRPQHYRDAVRRFQGPRSAILLFGGQANRMPRPLTGATVRQATGALFTAWGGQARLEHCLGEIPGALPGGAP